MDKLINFFLKRKLIVYMLTFMILFAGLGALVTFKVFLVPKTNLPWVMVSISGGSLPPEEMEKKIIDPIEKNLKNVPEIAQMTSVARTGSVEIMFKAKEGEGNNVKQKVESTVNNIRNTFPKEIDFVNVVQIDYGDEELIHYALIGEDMPALFNLAQTNIKERIEAVDGVKELKINADKSGFQNQVSITFIPERLMAYSLTPQNVIQQLSAANAKQAVGTLQNSGYDTVVEVDKTLKNISEFNQISIKTPIGIVPLGQLAHVRDMRGVMSDEYLSLYKGKPYIYMEVKRAESGEIISTQKEVEEIVAKINQEANGKYQIVTIFETASFIEHAVSNLSRDVTIGAVLAIVILFFFLKNWRVTMIIATTLPMSVLMTFIALKTNGYNIDLITLISLSLSVGLIVDAAIVVLESIYHFREKGENLTRAIVKGTREVVTPVLSSQLTMIVVFLPLILADFDEATAPIFQTMAFTVSSAVIASTIAAFFFVPIFSDTFLKNDKNISLEDEKKKPMFLVRGFYSLLNICLRHRAWTIVTAVLIFASTFVLGSTISGNMGMDLTENTLSLRVVTPSGTPMENTQKLASDVEKTLSEFKEVHSLFITGSKNSLELIMDLVPKTQRDLDKNQLQTQMIERLSQLPGVERASSAGSESNAPVAVAIKGQDLETAKRLTKEVEQMLLTIPGVQNPYNDFSKGSQKLILVPRSEAMERMGVDDATLTYQLVGFMGEQKITKISSEGLDIEVVAKYPSDWMKHPDQLRTLSIITNQGNSVPLLDLVDLKYSEVPEMLKHEEGERVVTVAADLSTTDSAGVASQIQEKIDAMNKPTGFKIELAGSLKSQGQNLTTSLMVFAGAICLIYLIMVAQFGRLSHPFIIMLTLPMAAFGVVIGFVLTGRDFTPMAIIGVTMLIGIVVSNAILLIDRINLLRSRGMDLNEAIIQGTRDRVRPVLMTKLTAILGMLPMGLAYAEGSTFEAPLATVVISGLIFHTLITLLLVPVLYSLFEGFFAQRRQRKELRMVRRASKKSEGESKATINEM